jgi:hypothetical protein
MKFMSLKLLSLPVALCSVLAGCRAATGDPMAEAPPPVRLEKEDFIQVDHPERFPVVTAIEHISPSGLTVVGTVTSGISGGIRPVPIDSSGMVKIRAELKAGRETPSLRQSAPTHAWVVCEVDENDLDAIQIGAIVEIRLNAYPDKIFIGRISSAGPVSGAMHIAIVRIEVTDLGSRHAGVRAAVTFHPGGNETHAAIPVTAVSHMHDRDWVYVPAGDQKFRRVDVFVGKVLPGKMAEITSGIEPGQRVVVNASALQTAAEMWADEISSWQQE